MKKKEFIRILNKLDKKELIIFIYDQTGNDVWNPCGTLQRQAKYEFKLMCSLGDVTIIEKQHRRDFNTVSNELIERYSKWAREQGFTNMKADLIHCGKFGRTTYNLPSF